MIINHVVYADMDTAKSATTDGSTTASSSVQCSSSSNKTANAKKPRQVKARAISYDDSKNDYIIILGEVWNDRFEIKVRPSRCRDMS